jgi:hypothetical protein
MGRLVTAVSGTGGAYRSARPTPIHCRQPSKTSRIPMKLNPEELTVTSFDTAAREDYLSPVTIRTINDPTAATHCYYCPPATLDCY